MPRLHIPGPRPARPGVRTAALAAGLLLALVPAVAFGQETHAEEESGGIAALGFSLPALVSNLINFTILLIVLRLFLYAPIIKLLDERKRKIQEGLERAEQAADAASVSEQESRRVIEEAQAQARQLMLQAQEASAQLRTDLEARARADAEQIVTRAREEVRVERDQAIELLRREFADLTITAAERVTRQSLDRAAHQRLIDEVLVGSELGNQN
jgi:F-type H+-transporting ATPase subunit b